MLQGISDLDFAHDLTCAPNHRANKSVLKLSDIARPAMSKKKVLRLGGQLSIPPIGIVVFLLVINPRHEVVNQKTKVTLTITKRGERQYSDRESVVKIGAETNIRLQSLLGSCKSLGSHSRPIFWKNGWERLTLPV